MDDNGLRPVLIRLKGQELSGFFHQFVHHQHLNYSVTQALVELEDGRIRLFDPYFVQFTDRLKHK